MPLPHILLSVTAPAESGSTPPQGRRSEGLGALGRGEGIAAQAIVLLVRHETPTGVEPTTGPEVRELIARMDVESPSESPITAPIINER